MQLCLPTRFPCSRTHWPLTNIVGTDWLPQVTIKLQRVELMRTDRTDSPPGRPRELARGRVCGERRKKGRGVGTRGCSGIRYEMPMRDLPGWLGTRLAQNTLKHLKIALKMRRDGENGHLGVSKSWLSETGVTDVYSFSSVVLLTLSIFMLVFENNGNLQTIMNINENG